ncbi:hypothetical protein IAT38_000696 [Cryptococcus sp. DSM 104549]
MRPCRIPLLALRPHLRPTSTSTIAHVLRLVQHNYLEHPTRLASGVSPRRSLFSKSTAGLRLSTSAVQGLRIPSLAVRSLSSASAHAPDPTPEPSREEPPGDESPKLSAAAPPLESTPPATTPPASTPPPVPPPAPPTDLPPDLDAYADPLDTYDEKPEEPPKELPKEPPEPPKVQDKSPRLPRVPPPEYPTDYPTDEPAFREWTEENPSWHRRRSDLTWQVNTRGEYVRPPQTPPDTYRLPWNLYCALRWQKCKDAASFIKRYEKENPSLEVRRLASLSNLLRVFNIFWRTAKDEDWDWMALQMEGLLRMMKSEKKVQRGMPAMAAAVRAYALFQLGADARKVRAAVSLGEKVSNYSTDSHPHSHAILAMVYARLGLWDQGRVEMQSSLARLVRLIGQNPQNEVLDYPSFDGAYLRDYVAQAEAAGRTDEVIQLVLTSSWVVRFHLIRTAYSGSQSTLHEVVYDAFRRIKGPPVKWWSGLRNSLVYPESVTAVAGAVMFMALLEKPARLAEAQALYLALSANNVRCPDEAPAIMVEGLVLNRAADARAMYGRVLRDYEGRLNVEAMFRLMKRASKAKWAEEEKMTWALLRRGVQPKWEMRINLAKMFAEEGRVEETRESLTERIGRGWVYSEYAQLVVLKAHINANDAQGARETLDKITDIRPMIQAFNLLLKFYADQGDVIRTVELFDRIYHFALQPDEYSYNALLTLFSVRRDPVNARKVYSAMAEAGVSMSPVTHATMLNAEIMACDWAAVGVRWASLPHNLQRHPAIAGTMLRALVLLPAPIDQVVALFRMLQNPTSRNWSLMIQAACDAHDMVLARQLYEEMDERARNVSGIPQPPPDVYTYSVLLNGYMRRGDSVSARAVYDEMVFRQIVPTSVTYSIIIQSFADAGGARALAQAHQFALRVAAEIKKGNIADVGASKDFAMRNVLSPLVVAHGKRKNWEEAEAYAMMLDEPEGRPPLQLSIAISQLMGAHRKAHNVDKVIELWSRLFEKVTEVVPYRNEKVPGMSGAALEKAGESTGAEAQPQPQETVEQQEDKADETSRSAPEGNVLSKLPRRITQAARTNDNILCIPLSILLDTLARANRYDLIVESWREVAAAGFGFDAVNYNGLAVALVRTGDVEGAFQVANHVLLRRYDDIKHRYNPDFRGSPIHEEEWRVRREAKRQRHREARMERNIQAAEIAQLEPGNVWEEYYEGPQVEPALHPPNRRRMGRLKRLFPPLDRYAPDLVVPDFPDPRTSGTEDQPSQTSLLVERWRPRDKLWRPTMRTLHFLQIALVMIYHHYPKGTFEGMRKPMRRRMQLYGMVEGEAEMGQEAELEAAQEAHAEREHDYEETHDDDGRPESWYSLHEGPINLPMFKDVYLLDTATGKPTMHTNPRAFIRLLRVRYPQLTSLLTLYRRRWYSKVREARRRLLLKRGAGRRKVVKVPKIRKDGFTRPPKIRATAAKAAARPEGTRGRWGMKRK